MTDTPPPPTSPAAKTLLLVDDEPNILSALQRLLRRDGYRILATDDPLKGLDMLAGEHVDVILSDQRMPGMSGVEFLRRAKETHPDSIRIVLSGYTDLQFITDAINEGAIYKFLTKPWEDDQLRENIREAFHRKGIDDENRRLNQALREANVELQAHALEKERQARRIEVVLDTLQEVLQLIPWPIVGVDETGLIALTNNAADTRLGAEGAPLLGREADEALPRAMRAWIHDPASIPEQAELDGRRYQVIHKTMGQHSRSQGTLLALMPCEQCP